MKTAMCKIAYNHGHFETDALIVTSPSGKSLTLRLHQEGVPESNAQVIRDIIEKTIKADRVKYMWMELHPMQPSDPNWSLYIKKLSALGGMFHSCVELSYEELAVFKASVEAVEKLRKSR